jgi:hypothetical protein
MFPEPSLADWWPREYGDWILGQDSCKMRDRGLPKRRSSMNSSDALDLLLERQAITDLLTQLCHYVDTFQLDALVEEVYALDGSDDHGRGPVVGRQAIKAWYEDSTANVASIAHNISNVWIELDERSAIARSNVIAWVWTMATADQGTTRVADYALSLRYFDKIRKYDEGWRIQERVLVPNVTKTGDPYLMAIGILPATQKGIQALSRRPLPPD